MRDDPSETTSAPGAARALTELATFAESEQYAPLASQNRPQVGPTRDNRSRIVTGGPSHRRASNGPLATGCVSRLSRHLRLDEKGPPRTKELPPMTRHEIEIKVSQ